MASLAVEPDKEEAAASGGGIAPAAASFSNLVLRLPKARNAIEVFSLFAEYLELEVPGLINTSVLHLPKAAAPFIAAYGAQRAQLAALKHGTGTAATSGPASGKGRGGAAGTPPIPQPAHADGLPGTALGPQLDWSNCCVFTLLKLRGPVVQAPPSWPLTCTAAFHAGVTVQELVHTSSYSTDGPHFQDWTAQHAKGAESMACVPLLHCGMPAGVLCLASSARGAFAGKLDLVRLLASALAPYAGLLEYTTRTTEMQRLLNEIITPIAAQLAQQKSSQLARLGCSIEEDHAADQHDKARRNNGCCISSPTTIKIGTAAMLPLSASLSHDGTQQHDAGGAHHLHQHKMQALPPSTGGAAANGSSACGTPSARQRHQKRSHVDAPGPYPAAPPSPALPAPSPAHTHAHAHGGSAANAAAPSAIAGAGGIGASSAGGGTSVGGSAALLARAGALVEPLVDPLGDPLGLPGDMDGMDWGDFVFNLVSMCIVYVYFSKAAVASESLVAIVLCMGVAAFDIVLLLLRWLWLEQYIAYGGFVIHFFQLYRAVVLPIANTWMSWSLLTKLDLTPSYGIIALLGLLLLLFVILGLQVRFFLHAPLQLASVLFAASSTTDICALVFNNTSSLNCIAIISVLQLSLGLLLPSCIVWMLEAKGKAGRTFMPHVQAKRWLLHP